MKKILIVWTLIAVILISGLTFVGFKIKEQNKPYRLLESELESKAEALIGEYPSLINNGNILEIDDFLNNNYEVDMTVNGDKCEGYVLIEKKLSIYSYKAYLKCNSYETTGYSK
jgi:hypothetical protein